MDALVKKILKNKFVSVWGLGYLGYTTILKLQSSGFYVSVSDLNLEQLRMFCHEASYPTKEQVIHWSRLGYLPRLDYSRIRPVQSAQLMFKNAYVHFITIPESFKNIEQGVLEKLAEIFSEHLKKNTRVPMIVFESGYIPGHIEKNFIAKLQEKGLQCARDYFLGVWFRTDWTVESFVSQTDKMPVAGYCHKSLEILLELCRCLGVSVIALENIREAEIYINSMNTIQAMVNDFARQLSFGYPTVNLRRLSELLFKHIKLDECNLNMGTGGTQMTFAIDYLIEGSSNPGSLTLLKEFQDFNISSVLNYGEYIKRHGYKDVTILGLTYKGNIKDMTLSPSMTLADYLIKNSIAVSINDPLFDKDEIKRMVRQAHIVNFPGKIFDSEVLIIASDHHEYKYLSQTVVDRIRKKTKLIIDNYGIWSHLSFGKKIKYFQVGDGSLNILK